MDHQKVKEGTQKLCVAVNDLKIESTANYDEGANMRAIIKERMKKLEDARKLMIAPHLQKQREINALFKEQTAPLTTLLKTLDYALLTFKKKEIESVKKKKDQQTEGPPIEAIERQTKTAKGTTSLKKVWKGEVVNRNLVWRKYPDFFIVDQRKVDEMARVIQAETEVDGIRLYSEDILSTRT